MGTNKRYADRIEARMNERIQEIVDRPRSETRRSWVPPWPPIRIGEGEWIIMRDSEREPVGIIKIVRIRHRGEERSFFRVVTWAERSEQRELVGYFRTLDEADASIRFSPKSAGPEGGPRQSRT